MKSLVFIVSVFLILALTAAVSTAGVPGQINFQGKLTDSLERPVDTVADLRIFIFGDQGGATALWTETHPNVTVTKGLFDIAIGSINPIPDSVFDGQKRWLGMEMESGSLSSPLLPVVSVAYAMRSRASDTAAYAQAGPGSGATGWVDDGSIVRLETLADRVGIGTTSPNENLVVGGDLGDFPEANYIVAGNPNFEGYSGFKLGWNADNHATINWLGDGNQLRFSTRSMGINYNNTMVLSNGHVGIGTESPTFKLEVISNGTGDGFRVTSSNGSQLFRVRESSAGSGETYISDDVGNTGVLLRGLGNSYFDAGNVGIGTTSPAGKLHVVGNGNSSVQLPDDAIAAHEMFNEPGISHQQLTSNARLATYEINLMSVGVICPTAGYVMVQATIDVYAWLQLQESWALTHFCISQTISDCEGEAVWDQVVNEHHLSQPAQRRSVNVHAVFQVNSPGTKRFYLVGWYNGEVGYIDIEHANMTAIFYPTWYGTESFPAAASSQGR